MLTGSFSTLHYPNISLRTGSLPEVDNKNDFLPALFRLANVDRLRLISTAGILLRMAFYQRVTCSVRICTPDLGCLRAQSV